MAKAQLTVGMTIDGFRLDERIHRGGMADIWRVSRNDIDFPTVMKVPLLDFEGDIYGERLRLELWERLRDERAFASEQELVDQISADVEAAQRASRPG